MFLIKFTKNLIACIIKGPLFSVLMDLTLGKSEYLTGKNSTFEQSNLKS